MDSLTGLLTQVPAGDCIVLLTDLNEQLPANVAKVTGKWAFGEASQNAGKMVDMLRQFDLFAINTSFQAKRRSSNATFVKMTAVESYETIESYGDLEFLTGKQVVTRYQNKRVKGTVKALDVSNNDELKKWTVVFEDNYTMRCSEKWIKKHLTKTRTKTKRKRIQKQIDYIFVSNRW